MKVYLTDQTENFEVLLRELIAKPTMKFDKSTLVEKVSSIKINTHQPVDALNLACLFDYNIFPNAIITALPQWLTEKRKMRTGDVILQQAFIPPLKFFSQKIVFGVRINNIIDEANRKGFSYETLEGHVEKGESTFTVEQHDSGVTFTIRTFSQPGNLLTRLLKPVVTVPYQAYCTRRALENVRQQLEEE